MGGEAHTNRLIHEKSPYLLQHAHNPVDWFPWGEEAFEKARSEDKPIFLSIGYATCHWCHVMEKESFENPEIAKLLNESFVNIKVDREEHPHVDSMYMELAQGLMSTAGGWPLNLLLTPDLKPFFAVTYLPPEARRGLVGFPQVILQVKEIWQGPEREKLIEQADRLLEMVAEISPKTGEVLPNEASIDKSIEALFEICDPVFGGIRGEPKFPMSYQLEFLLGYAKKHSDSRALFLAEVTYDRMARGGIYDQLGGGFSRYSVDDHWIVPHFEKMLYDNALLISAYTEAFLFTRNPLYRQVVEETIAYVSRELKAKEGGFFSAEDADSEGHEGRYYTWTPAEIKMILSSPQAERVCLYYGVSPQGNFEGRSVLNVDTPLEEIAGQLKIPFDTLRLEVADAKKRLFEKRSQRPKPFIDDKILSSWNGLMAHALAKSGEVLQKKAYLDLAVQTLQVIKSELWKEGTLLRRYRDGEARFNACLEEYACLIKALLTLFEAGLGTSHLLWALEMTEKLEKEFKVEGGAFYQTDGKEPLLMRKCELYDGAEPSGNALHAENLLRLYKITAEEKYIAQAEDIFKAAKMLIDAYPAGACYHLLALERYYDRKAPLIVIALNEQKNLMEEIRRELSQRQEPYICVVWKIMDDADLVEKVPGLADKRPIDGQTTVYLCRGHTCQKPLVKPEEIMSTLRGFYG